MCGRFAVIANTLFHGPLFTTRLCAQSWMRTQSAWLAKAPTTQAARRITQTRWPDRSPASAVWKATSATIRTPLQGFRPASFRMSAWALRISFARAACGSRPRATTNVEGAAAGAGTLSGLVMGGPLGARISLASGPRHQSRARERNQAARVDDRLPREREGDDVERRTFRAVLNAAPVEGDHVALVGRESRRRDGPQAEVDRVLQEDAGVAPRDDHDVEPLEARRGLLARRPAAEVLPRGDDGALRDRLRLDRRLEGR